ncbi:hypothetical protein CP02DC14_2164A, partial [Chlamydia psittaci 02DC14]
MFSETIAVVIFLLSKNNLSISLLINAKSLGNADIK